jgi:hypothetical protein
MRYDWSPIVNRKPLRWPHGFREFLAHARAHADVWWTTREEIATWYLANHAGHIG